MDLQMTFKTPNLYDDPTYDSPDTSSDSKQMLSFWIKNKIKISLKIQKNYIYKISNL